MDGITGYSPVEAAEEIAAFYGAVLNLEIDFHERGAWTFMTTLEKIWCSPNAVEFGKKHFQTLYNLATNIKTVGKNICINAVAAYNIVARSNGASTINASEFTSDDLASPDISEPSTFTLKDVSDKGVVGMNYSLVKLAVSEFKNQVEILIHGLNELPMDIAFYDPSGELKAAYKREIALMVEKIETEAKSIYADIDAALETEINTILLAKEDAAETMAA